VPFDDGFGFDGESTCRLKAFERVVGYKIAGINVFFNGSGHGSDGEGERRGGARDKRERLGGFGCGSVVAEEVREKYEFFFFLITAQKSAAQDTIFSRLRQILFDVERC
jgi:hypothetical protein